MKNFIKKDVNRTSIGVNISFSGEIKKQNIEQMVQNCSTGACECMSDTTKKKIENMEINGKDGDVELSLTGDITKEEIEEALAKSTII